MRHRAPSSAVALFLWLALLLAPHLAGRSWAAVLEAYPSETSVIKGDALELHVRSQAQTYSVSIWRQGSALEHILDVGQFSGQSFTVPDSVWQQDCSWPVTCRVPVPGQWRCGAYVARLEGGNYVAQIPFVVRESVAGSAASILLQLSIDTWQAYNYYGGKNLYKAYGPGLTGRAHRVTFHRPYNYFAADGSGQFFLWEAPFISWLESEGYTYEVCTNVDLHREPGLLSSYQLFVSLGHDEYYSREMFDELERFVDTGGNLAFFSANTLWWQVRFEDQEHTMVCYKDRNLDPLNGVDDSRVTVNWHAAPVLRPPARLMGIYYNGSAGIPPGAQQVVRPSHWAFRGVTVDSGQVFGYPMVGYEVDARNADSPPILDVICRTELPDLNDGGVLRPSEMVYYERTPAYGFPNGRGGKVFAAGTINYVGALVTGYNPWMKTVSQPDPVARAIALNVLDRLGCSLRPPRLGSPADNETVEDSQVLFQWDAALAQRPAVPVRYTVFRQGPSNRIDSLVTSNLSVRAPVPPDSTYRWWVRGASECGASAQSAAWSFRTVSPSDSFGSGRLPLLAVARDGNIVVVLVSMRIPASGTVAIFDVAGRSVRSFGSRLFGPGRTRLEWDLTNGSGQPAASGVYFVNAHVGSQTARQKISVVR